MLNLSAKALLKPFGVEKKKKDDSDECYNNDDDNELPALLDVDDDDNNDDLDIEDEFEERESRKAEVLENTKDV
ncbi:hypothetical protein BT96DRAFT_996745 [Gymnopus androsaceus JB14]|uniref:Uncharacterized protein n=1 Tax=Gymnopus androsaceus JB14 TaxID=1447944 RepID=A0A6A4HEX2_9AGAR|nr:hypothetical protein BT96DRAFT_996745 [Gymnopus androsaceus JB14]